MGLSDLPLSEQKCIRTSLIFGHHIFDSFRFRGTFAGPARLGHPHTLQLHWFILGMGNGHPHHLKPLFPTKAPTLCWHSKQEGLHCCGLRHSRSTWNVVLSWMLVLVLAVLCCELACLWTLFVQFCVWCALWSFKPKQSRLQISSCQHPRLGQNYGSWADPCGTCGSTFDGYNAQCLQQTILTSQRPSVIRHAPFQAMNPGTHVEQCWYEWCWWVATCEADEYLGQSKHITLTQHTKDTGF